MPWAQKAVELLYKMLRLRTALLILLFVAIADAASKTTGSYYNPELLLIIAILAGWYIYGTSVNDLADEEIDQVNLRGNANRPLINHQASRKSLWYVASIGAIAVIILSGLIGLQALAVTICALLLSYCYSMPPLQFSYRGILAPLVLPLGYVVYPFYLTFLVNNADFSQQDVMLVAVLYTSFIGRIILKDFRDVKGDRQYGKRTFVVRHGTYATCAVSSAAWVAAFGLLVWRFLDLPMLWLTTIPFCAGILYYLHVLADESKLKRQILIIGLIGRLANGSALLILTALYYELTPNEPWLYSVLLIGMMLFNLNAAYVLYRPLLVARSSAD